MHHFIDGKSEPRDGEEEKQCPLVWKEELLWDSSLLNKPGKSSLRDVSQLGAGALACQGWVASHTLGSFLFLIR